MSEDQREQRRKKRKKRGWGVAKNNNKRRQKYRAKHTVPANVAAFKEFVKTDGPLDKKLRGGQKNGYKPSVVARKTEIDNALEALERDDLPTFRDKLRDLLWDPDRPWGPPFARKSVLLLDLLDLTSKLWNGSNKISVEDWKGAAHLNIR